MRRHDFWFGIWLALIGVPTATVGAQTTFSGSDSSSTATFRMEGPWLVAWQVGSDFPMLAYAEIHLYDATNNRHLGVIAQQYGVGKGEKLIREPGEYRLSISGRNVDWHIRTEEADEEVMAVLRANPDLTELRLTAPSTGLRRDLVERVVSWRAENDRALLLSTSDGGALSVSFYEGGTCQGLAEAKTINFLTGDLRGEVFNAIVLEDGTRCYLDGFMAVD